LPPDFLSQSSLLSQNKVFAHLVFLFLKVHLITMRCFRYLDAVENSLNLKSGETFKHQTLLNVIIIIDYL
jgi:hypothetical protein